MVPRGGIEPPTQGFSGPCSTTELPRLFFQSLCIIYIKYFFANFFYKKVEKIIFQLFYYFFYKESLKNFGLFAYLIASSSVTSQLKTN